MDFYIHQLNANQIEAFVHFRDQAIESGKKKYRWTLLVLIRAWEADRRAGQRVASQRQDQVQDDGNGRCWARTHLRIMEPDLIGW